MKNKKLLATSLAVLLLMAGSFNVFAKENKMAATYKGYETKDKNAPVVYFIKDITHCKKQNIDSNSVNCVIKGN